MPEMHFRQPVALDKSGFTYSACGPFTKNKELDNELDKACFQHDMTYGDFRDLTRKTASHKILHDKAFNTAKNPNMMVINANLLQWSQSFFIKNPLRLPINSASGRGIKNENTLNK